MKNPRDYLFALVTFALLIGAASCNQAAAVPTATIVPTAIPAPTATPAPTLEPGDSEHKLTVNGLERTYLLHIPPGVDGLHPAPAVLAFHALNERPGTMKLTTGFNEIADQAGFVVVYPQGVGLSWNAGETCCGEARAKDIDDTAFTRQILSDLETIVSIDDKRIYATGFSNGALFAYRLACEMPDTLAAIAPVGGSLVYTPCQPQQPVSLIHVHGLDDAAVPFKGGGQIGAPPVKEVITNWVEWNGCTGSAQVDIEENIVVRTSYTTCRGDTAVELVTIESLGHVWPSKYIWPVTQAIWDFFAAHPKP